MNCAMHTGDFLLLIIAHKLFANIVEEAFLWHLHTRSPATTTTFFRGRGKRGGESMFGALISKVDSPKVSQAWGQNSVNIGLRSIWDYSVIEWPQNEAKGLSSCPLHYSIACYPLPCCLLYVISIYWPMFLAVLKVNNYKASLCPISDTWWY